MAVQSTEDLMKRFRDLEASQARLWEQLDAVLREAEAGGGAMIPGIFDHSPYWSVLHHIGHALYVRRTDTGEIIFWNRSAEYLYGWMDYEALGQRVTDLIVYEESQQDLEKVTERLNCGQVWSGQIPLKNRSGEVFTAMVTESPLYEDGQFIAIVTVSNDASTFNSMHSEKSRVHWDRAHGKQRESKINFKRVQRHPQQQIQSSVMSLASKLFPRNSTNWGSVSEDPQERCECMQENENVQLEKREIPAPESSFKLHVGRKAMEEKLLKYEDFFSKFNQQIKIAKVFAKFQIRGKDEQIQADEGNQTGPENMLSCNSVNKATEPLQPMLAVNYNCASLDDAYIPKKGLHNLNPVHRYVKEGQSNNTMISECSGTNFSEVLKRKFLSQWSQDSERRAQSSDKSNPFMEIKSGVSNGLGQSEMEGDWKKIPETSNEDFSYQANPWKNHASQNKAEDMQSSISTISEETTGSSQEGSSTNEEKDTNLVTDCDISWEDLLVGEEIGEGFYAIVYRGIWHGSDVAIKIYLGKDYSEGVLLDYKEEVNIMKKLRHPNVLLFMGAAYSPDRLAIVTELLPRGSLFKTLHKNNQALDIKRRLRMALDVARGMNYLHRRKPPIIHRDLKSSNLLVDRNWNVKVGDFGLSRLKNSTVLTANSGRGTAQWMAPEVLRGECTSEKSDVFSFGVVLWELMTESVPWSHLIHLQVVGMVGFLDQRLDIPEGMDQRISSIISDCWESDPGRRPSFEEILGRMAELVAEPANRRSGNRPPGASPVG